MNDAAAVAEGRPLLMGQVAGAIEEILSAKQIIDDMMHSATETIQNNYRMLSKL
jgi:NAD(P)H-dependent flavin oxidoreductase YrpB (nitropropane dioxygenase family)